jgi:nitrate reductase NapE component
MLKYILIWFCIGYFVALIYFIYYFKFDINVLFYDTNWKIYGLTDEDVNEMRSSNALMQIIVSIAVIIFIVIWPILIVDFVRTFKRKLR